MVAVSIAVAGSDAVQQVSQLREVLLAADSQVGPVEVDRDPALVVAVINTVLVGVPVAQLLWDWWQPHRSGGATAKITLGDGTVIELDNLTEASVVDVLAAVLADREPPRTSR